MPAESPRVTAALIAIVLVVGAFVYFFYPQATPEPPEGRVLAQVQVVEPVGPGFRIAHNFTIDADYDRLALSYNLSVASHVRAALSDPDGVRFEAEPVARPDGDELILEIFAPAHGRWTFEVWTLDETERQGSIESGDLYILGFGGPDDGSR